MPHSYRMRYEHFPLFTHGIVRAQSECPASRQASSYIRSVSTASSSAIGSTYMRCTRVHVYLHVSVAMNVLWKESLIAGNRRIE